MTIKELSKEVRPYLGTLITTTYCWNIVLLVGYARDELDLYYLVEDPKRGVVWYSCVGGFVPMKGYLRDEDYGQMVRIWNLNNKQKAK